jgi:hypothetical protein
MTFFGALLPKKNNLYHRLFWVTSTSFLCTIHLQDTFFVIDTTANEQQQQQKQFG